MFLGASPFAEAAGEGLGNVLEVAIAEVQEEFLDGVLNLDPRVIPSVGLVKAFQLGIVLHDGCRMC